MTDILNDMIYQKRCVICGKLMDHTSEYCECGDCRSRLFPITGEICGQCGVEVRYCKCGGVKNVYDRVAAPFYYHGLTRKLIHGLKFREQPQLVGLFAREMVGCMVGRYRHVGLDTVIAVPMTARAERERGYNQTKLLAERIAKLTYLPFSKGILIKNRETKRQHDLSYFERLNNLHGSYEIADEGAIEGKTVLLCDDVKTTGATLNECAYVLRLGGARAVYALCAAINPPRGWSERENRR